MADLMKRVHYFDHQFLRVEDFTCEQDYHMAMRRLHNRLLYTPGIAQGLEVDYKPGAAQVTIKPGTALDSKGCEIVLTEDQPQLLPTEWTESQKYWLTIAYHEERTDQTEETGVKGFTRWTETPVIKWSEDPGQEVVLAQVRRSDDKVTVDSSEKVRTAAGAKLAKLGDTTARKLTLTRDGVDSSQWPALSCGAAKRIDLTGDFSVSGNLGIGTPSPLSPLAVSGGAAIGSGYADKKAPDNGLIVQGQVGIGTTAPEATLDVRGTLKANVTMAGLIFNGEKKDYVKIPEMIPDYAKGFTVEAWVCYHSFRWWSRIIDFGNGPLANNIVFANREKTNDLSFQVYVGQEGREIIASRALKVNTWMHLAATVDANGQAALYKNGQLLVTDQIKLPRSVKRVQNFIGHSNWEDPDDYFDGKIAEVRIWDHARTAAEIKNDMNIKLSGSEPGLVGYWPCDDGADDGADDRVKDLTTNQYHGTRHGAQWFQEEIPAMAITGYGNVGIGTTSLEATLDVNGDLRVSGLLFAPSSLGIYSDTTEKWDNDTDSKEWNLLLKREITLSAPTRVLVLGHGHGRTSDENTRLDLVIVIDEEDPPDDGYCYGMGLSHSTAWVPMIAVTASSLHTGDHTIELKYRVGHWETRKQTVYCCGVSMHTMFLGSAL